MLARYKRRKVQALSLLGNICVLCGNQENLEFDHKERITKKATIADIWSANEKRFWEEVAKCQLLCISCHRKKTLEDLGQISAKNSHGTLSAYRYCKCELCRKAHREYTRKWYSKNKEDVNRKKREKRRTCSSEEAARDF